MIFFFSASTTLVYKRHRYIDTRAQRESAPLRRTEETRACPASVDPLVWFVFPRGRSAPTSSPRPPATPEEGGGTEPDIPTAEAEAMTSGFSGFESSLYTIKIFSKNNTGLSNEGVNELCYAKCLVYSVLKKW